VTNVDEPSAADRRWQALADELAPTKSLQRIDAANTRVVATVSAVATVLTGLGLLAAGAANLPGAGRWLAVGAVMLAVAALLVALRGQTVTVTRNLNLNNLVEVEQWYRKRFERRAPSARTATILLTAAIGCAGLAAAVSLLVGGDEAPTLAVTRTADVLSVDITFRGLDADEVATATVAVDGQLVTAAAFGPSADGTASRTLPTLKMPAGSAARLEAQGGDTRCTALVEPDNPPEIACVTS
jgi:hypothetical protein